MTVLELKKILAGAENDDRIYVASTSDNYGFECYIRTAFKNMDTGHVVIIADRRGRENVQKLCKPKESGKRETCFD